MTNKTRQPVILLALLLAISTTAFPKSKSKFATTETDCKNAKEKYAIASIKYGIQAQSEGDSILSLSRGADIGSRVALGIFAGPDRGWISFTPETNSCTVEYKGYLGELVVEKLKSGVASKKIPNPSK